MFLKNHTAERCRLHVCTFTREQVACFMSVDFAIDERRLSEESENTNAIFKSLQQRRARSSQL